MTGGLAGHGRADPPAGWGGTVFVQVILGVTMVAGQKIEAPKFHMFYGFVAIISVAIIYAYRDQMKAYRYLLYGGGGLFLMGLGIRAMIVGSR